MKPRTFGIIIFFELMLLDGIFAASTLKQRHHILPFEDANSKDVMKIEVQEIAPDTFTGTDNRETQALATVTGKTQVTAVELEKAALPDVQFEKEKP